MLALLNAVRDVNVHCDDNAVRQTVDRKYKAFNEADLKVVTVSFPVVEVPEPEMNFVTVKIKDRVIKRRCRFSFLVYGVSTNGSSHFNWISFFFFNLIPLRKTRGQRVFF